MIPSAFLPKSLRRRRRLAQLNDFEFHLWEAVGPAVSQEHLWHMAYGGYGDNCTDVKLGELRRLCDMVWQGHDDLPPPGYASLSYAAMLLAEIEKPPGTHIARFLELILPRRIFEAHARPAIAEWQLEYIDALGRGDRVLARFVRLRGIVWIALPILDCFWRSMVRPFSEAISTLFRQK